MDNICSTTAELRSEKYDSMLPDSSSMEIVSIKRPFFSSFDIFVSFVIEANSFIIDSTSLNDGKVYQVHRVYDDFFSLHNELFNKYSPSGLIIPLLPEMFQPEERVLTQQQESLLKECNFIFENAAEFSFYLRVIATHPILKAEKIFFQFISEKDFVRPEVSIKKKQSSIFNSLDKWIHTPANISDSEFFDNEKEFASSLMEGIKKMNESFENVLSCNRKVSNVLAHLSSCIISNLVIKESQSQVIVFNKLFCNSIDKYKTFLEVNGSIAHQKMGVVIQSLNTYNLSYKHMLSKRNELLVERETSSKQWKRVSDAKKRENALLNKEIIEKKFQCFNKNATKEVDLYHKLRCNEMTNSIYQYAQWQISMSKKTAAVLQNCIVCLNNINI